MESMKSPPRSSTPSKEKLHALQRYLETIVDPTIEEFRENPHSGRHAYIACLVAFHSVDRLERKGGNVKREWVRSSAVFALVEIVANTLKHVSMDNPTKKNHIPLRAAMFGAMGFNTHTFNESGPDVRQIYFAVRDAVTFIRQWAAKAEEK